MLGHLLLKGLRRMEAEKKEFKQNISLYMKEAPKSPGASIGLEHFAKTEPVVRGISLGG